MHRLLPKLSTKPGCREALATMMLGAAATVAWAGFLAYLALRIL